MIGKTLAHFEILKKLGTGGMGVVYKARDTRLLRHVALKVLSSEKTADTQKRRFTQEAQSASALNHPGIVAIYDFVDDQDVDFIVMEYVEGISLAQRIASKQLPWSEIKNYTKQIASAMAAAHSAGIIHRDLKPHNLMITKDGKIKILDFGIAKLNPATDFDIAGQTVQTALTGQGHVLGTLAYMSPEQALGDPVDARSDIFSFGIVLYEMLAGKRPFEGNSETSLLHQLHFDAPKPLASIRQDIPKSVDTLIQKALAKRPQDRLQSMNQFSRELEGLTTDNENLDAEKSKQPERPADISFEKVLESSDSHNLQNQTLSKVFLTLAKKPKQSFLGVTLLILTLAVLAAVGITQGLNLGAPKPSDTNEDHLLVLPFENISNDKTLDATCLGLTESLTNGLGQVREFKEPLQIVPAAEVRQSTVRSAKQAAEEFGANLIIAGSLQRQEENIRMNLSLVKGTTQLASATGNVPQKDQGSLERQALLKTVGLLRRQFDKVVKTKATVAPTVQKGAREFFKQGMGLLEEYVRRPDKKENIDKAIEAFQRGLAVDANYAPAHAGLSRAYWRKYIDNKDSMLIEQAVQTGRRAVELNPELSMARVSLGLALVHQGNSDEAVKELEQALALDPLSVGANHGLGEVWESRGDFQKAKFFYRDALALSPMNRDLLDLLGSLYYRMGRYKEAEQFYLKSIKAAPDNVVSHRSLGGIYVMMGKNAKAATHLQRALEIEPDAPTYSNLGAMYFFQGRYTDAVKAYEKTVQMPGGANDYISWGDLGDAYRWTPDNRDNSNDAYTVAVRLLGELLEQDPHNITLNSHMAFYLAKKGDTNDAQDSLKQVDKQVIQDPQIHYIYAVTLELIGKRQSALSSLKKALLAGYSLEDIRQDPELLRLRQDPEYHALATDYGQNNKNPTLK